MWRDSTVPFCTRRAPAAGHDFAGGERLDLEFVVGGLATPWPALRRRTVCRAISASLPSGATSPSGIDCAMAGAAIALAAKPMPAALMNYDVSLDFPPSVFFSCGYPAAPQLSAGGLAESIAERAGYSICAGTLVVNDLRRAAVGVRTQSRPAWRRPRRSHFGFCSASGAAADHEAFETVFRHLPPRFLVLEHIDRASTFL